MAGISDIARTDATDPAAQVSIRAGQNVTFDAKITSAGLLSVAALVTGILLSTAVIVSVATRKEKHLPAPESR